MKRCVLAILLILCIPTVLAESTFEVISPTSVCSGEQGQIQLRLFRTDSGSDRYVFSIEGEASLLHKAATLNQNQQSFVDVQISSKDVGIIPVTVTASSDTEELSVPVDITIKQCNGVTLLIPDASVCLDIPTPVQLTIDNPTDDTIEANINFSSLLDPLQISVPGESSKNFSVLVTMTDMKTKMLEASLDYGQGIRREKFTLNPVSAKKCFQMDVSPKRQYVTINQSKAIILVRNNGVRTASYQLELLGPDWATLDQNSLSVPSAEEREVALTINAPIDTTAQEFQLLASSQDIEYSSSFYLDFREKTPIGEFFLQNWAWFSFLIVIIIIIILGAIWTYWKPRKHSPVVENEELTDTKKELPTLKETQYNGKWSRKYAKINFDNIQFDTSFERTLPSRARPRTWIFLLILLVIIGGAIFDYVSNKSIISIIVFAVAVIAVLIFLISIAKKATKSYSQQSKYWKPFRWISVILYVGFLIVTTLFWRQLQYRIIVIIGLVLLGILLILLLLTRKMYEKLDVYFFTEKQS